MDNCLVLFLVNFVTYATHIVTFNAEYSPSLAHFFQDISETIISGQ